MIKINDKALASAVKNGTADKDELVKYFLQNSTIFELAEAAAELALSAREPITVSPEDFDRITSLFRVRGVKYVEGNIIKETRGRKPKSTLPIPED